MTATGRAIRKARLQKNWSQTALAQELHCHASLVSRWETGSLEPDLAQLAKLAAVLDSPELQSMLHVRVLRQTYEALALVAGTAA